MLDETGVVDTENTTEESDLNLDGQVEDQNTNDTDYKSLYEKEVEEHGKTKEVASNQKIRAEKAERTLKEPPKESKEEVKAPELSGKDLYALVEAKVPQDDVDEVLEYAKFKNIPVAKALESPVVKATLAHKAEVRKSAQATNTGPSSRGVTKASDDILLANARKGILPENEEDIQRLIALTVK